MDTPGDHPEAPIAHLTGCPTFGLRPSECPKGPPSGPGAIMAPFYEAPGPLVYPGGLRPYVWLYFTYRKYFGSRWF